MRKIKGIIFSYVLAFVRICLAVAWKQGLSWRF